MLSDLYNDKILGLAANIERLGRLDAPDALFLDGQVSRIYAPAMSRNEAGMDMGPIVGVVE